MYMYMCVYSMLSGEHVHVQLYMYVYTACCQVSMYMCVYSMLSGEHVHVHVCIQHVVR